MDATETETEIAYAGLAGQAELIRSREISARELTQTLLKRIERLDPTLNAFRIVLYDEALAEAAARDRDTDQAAQTDERKPLHGVPIAIKDELDVAGQLTTFGGAARTKAAPADSEPVRRLRAAGAVIIGKTRMPEFGQFPFTESAAGGYTRNPWDVTRTPGGSSGGTAAAVAAGLTAAGMGGDGGGSIRIPAACCGLFGLKPQRGRVSMPDIWHALGTVGPLTRTVLDSALIYDAIRGSLPSDRYRAREPATTFVEAAQTEPRRLKIALSARPATLGVRLAPEQRGALERTAATLRDLGHEVREVELRYPSLEPAFVPQFYGGVRDEAATVERPDLLERRTKQTLALARLFPPRVVNWAVGHGERLAAKINRIFDEHDLLLTPTIPSVPRSLGALDGVGSLHASLRAVPYVSYTATWNVCGNPAASVPAGSTQAGLPLAVQLVAPPDDEVTLFAVAAQLERAAPWAGRRPPVG
jgi:amidase